MNIDEDTLQNLVNTWRVKNGTMSQEVQNIAENGKKAVGVVLENIPTGKVDNGMPELNLRIKVTTKEGKMYETQVTKCFMPGAVPFLQVGCTADVYYLPEDPHNIAIGTRIA